MRGVLKWLGYIAVALVVLIVVAAGAIYLVSQNKLGNGYDVTPDAVTVPTDAAAIARGEHIARYVADCVGCHTQNFGGQVFIDEPGFAVLYAPNLTSGQGGVGGNYADADWVRALRHGVAADGRALLAMPAQWYYYLTDADLGALIAYLKTLPPVDNPTPARTVAFFPTRMLVALGQFPTAVELIARNEERSAPEASIMPEYGEYISRVAACRECHGSNLAGGTNPGAPTGPNITPGGPLAAYTEENFLTLMHSGQTPGGRTVSEEMPWVQFGGMSDDELKALFAYIKSLEALPANGS